MEINYRGDCGDLEGGAPLWDLIDDGKFGPIRLLSQDPEDEDLCLEAQIPGSQSFIKRFKI